VEVGHVRKTDLDKTDLDKAHPESGVAAAAPRATPGADAARCVRHANDNHIARHDPARATKRPALTCRWVPSATGGLECRWFLANGEAARAEEPGAACERPVAAGGRHLTLVVK
jgi:hypothetical protein